MRRLFVIALVLALFSVGAAVSAKSEPEVIVLPGATSAEGIATGAGSTFYAGDLFTGDIFRGDLSSGEVDPFINAPAGRMAVGLKADLAHDLLFVAGGLTGQAYVYDLTTGATARHLPIGSVHQRRRGDEGRRLVHRYRSGSPL